MLSLYTSTGLLSLLAVPIGRVVGHFFDSDSRFIFGAMHGPSHPSVLGEVLQVKNAGVRRPGYEAYGGSLQPFNSVSFNSAHYRTMEVSVAGSYFLLALLHIVTLFHAVHTASLCPAMIRGAVDEAVLFGRINTK